MAETLGLGVLPWSPLGGSVLTGKYTRVDLSDYYAADVSPTRKRAIASSGHLNERLLTIADVVGEIARESGATPSQVALAWTLNQSRGRVADHRRANARTGRGQYQRAGSKTFRRAAKPAGRGEHARPTFPDRFMARPMSSSSCSAGPLRPRAVELRPDASEDMIAKGDLR